MFLVKIALMSKLPENCAYRVCERGNFVQLKACIFVYSKIGEIESILLNITINYYAAEM